MESTPEAHDSLLSDQSPKPSNYSLDSNSTVVATPTSPANRRPGYHRLTSSADTGATHPGTGEYYRDDEEFGDDAAAQGLAIQNVETATRISMQRVPVVAKTTPATPRSTDTVSSPLSSRFSTRSTPVYDGISGSSHGNLQSKGSKPSLHEPFVADTELRHLNKKPSASTIRSIDPSGPLDFSQHCKSKHNICQGRGNWLSITILILAFYSTIFSGAWLLIAVIKPRYGQRITSNPGKLAPSTASLLCAAFAKTIELSFVTVFVALLGQVLSRRAIAKNSRGITLAEMSMRSWVMQPGTMITHWESVRYAGTTFLGAVALTGALMAMLYTTASDALVAPKLKFGGLENRLIYGQVGASFANSPYIVGNCKTPISTNVDPDNAGSTCIEIEHAGQAYHNYLQYLATWVNDIDSGNASAVNLTQRPNAVGMLYDNTTVQGSWINVLQNNMTELSLHWNRTLTNVSMAMPHAGVFAAVRDPINRIMQPQDLNGLGEYYIEASVPSPAVNVLCANMTKEELTPLVYSLWPKFAAANAALDASLYPNGYDIPMYPDWMNATTVDDLFGWGKKYGRRPPMFPKLPQKYNTVLNASIWFADSIYILGTSPTAVPAYTLCSLRASLSPNCSTVYHASMSGGSLNSHCDPNNTLAYRNSEPKAPEGFISTDWSNVATEWGLALSLDAGISDGNASNARLLTQLIPTSNTLSPGLPSIAEALAVLSGCTLLMSAQGSPFIHYWNYSTTVPTLKSPQYQAFNATLRTQDYSSGGVQKWQNIFYLVLLPVFITNVFCLVYFLVRGGLVTDFIEPQNLFSLSINSPASEQLAGSCGAGPVGEQFRTNWFIRFFNEHFYIQNGPEPAPRSVSKRKQARRLRVDAEGSRAANTYSKLANEPSSWL
ncbi:hypothetical protein LPUS_09061 [Lasallia pustulata]|uniref:Mcm2 3 5 family n=1 Tax=Lasallia pustulata TaxID=136370 RepID=A0A1W5D6I7_9LECA|nr:hypothetical protein LPUS_09061 [Lasallia pustulata]